MAHVMRKAPKTLAGSANFMQPGGAAEGLQEVGAGAIDVGKNAHSVFFSSLIYPLKMGIVHSSIAMLVFQEDSKEITWGSRYCIIHSNPYTLR